MVVKISYQNSLIWGCFHVQIILKEDVVSQYMVKNFLRWMKGHLLLSGIMVVGLGFGGYVGYQKLAPSSTEAVRYVTAPATKEMLVVAVGASGQVLTQDQLDVKPLVSGKIVKVMVKHGETVTEGQLIAEIDQIEALKAVRDTSQSVRDAQNSLAAARLSLAKLKQPPDTSTILQAQDAFNQAKREWDALREPPDPLQIQSAEADVASAEHTARLSGDGMTPQMVRDEYDQIVPLLNATLLFLQNALVNADNVLGIDNPAANAKFQSQLSSFNKGYRQQAESDYAAAKSATKTAQTLIMGIRPKNESVEVLARAETVSRDALRALTLVLRDVRNALLHTPPSPTFSQSEIDGLRSGIQSDLSSVDTRTTAFVTQEQAIDQAKSSYASARIALQKVQLALETLKKGPDRRDLEAAQEKVKEREQILMDVKAGAHPTDVALAQNTVDQRAASVLSAQNKFSDAQRALEDYHVLSPLAGIVLSTTARKGESVSPATALVTLATQQKVAQISLNEVDVTKIKVGQRATLTFDAIEDLAITGTVFQIDQAATVSQGVVSYGVKLTLDAPDERVRSGMSATASIIVQSKADVLVVPNAAVKQEQNRRYVEILPAGKQTPISATVQVGLSNDMHAEIIEGLHEGDQVVTQTIRSTPVPSAAPANTGLRIPGMTGGFGGGAGGGFRAGGGGTSGR